MAVAEIEIQLDAARRELGSLFQKLADADKSVSLARERGGANSLRTHEKQRDATRRRVDTQIEAVAELIRGAQPEPSVEDFANMLTDQLADVLAAKLDKSLPATVGKLAVEAMHAPLASRLSSSLGASLSRDLSETVTLSIAAAMAAQEKPTLLKRLFRKQ